MTSKEILARELDRQCLIRLRENLIDLEMALNDTTDEIATRLEGAASIRQQIKRTRADMCRVLLRLEVEAQVA